MSDQQPPAPGPQPGGGRRRSRRGGGGRSGNSPPGAGGNQQPRPPQAPRPSGPASAARQSAPGQQGGGGRSRRRGRGGSGNRGGGSQQVASAAPRDAELSDQTALERLREGGFQLDQVHELEAFIYFPNEANAKRALPALEEAGYATYPEPTGDGRWVVEAVIRAAPVPEYVAAMRRHLRGVAGPLGGLYDGWSAIPIDEEAEAEAARLAALEAPLETSAEAGAEGTQVISAPSTEPPAGQPVQSSANRPGEVVADPATHSPSDAGDAAAAPPSEAERQATGRDADDPAAGT